MDKESIRKAFDIILKTPYKAQYIYGTRSQFDSLKKIYQDRPDYIHTDFRKPDGS